MNLVKFNKVILVANISAIAFAIIGLWTFNFEVFYLPFLIFPGIAMIFSQKENKAYKFLDKLIVGSIYFGFISLLLNDLRDYVISNLFFHSGMPFMVVYNFKEYCIFSLFFSFICFMSGLVGIVVKGGCEIYKTKKF